MASLFTAEAGPFRVFERIRDSFAPPGPVTNQLGILLTCIWCCSVWTTIIMALVWFFFIKEIVIVIAAMAVALMVEELVSRGSK